MLGIWSLSLRLRLLSAAKDLLLAATGGVCKTRDIPYVSKLQTLCDEGHYPVLGNQGEPWFLMPLIGQPPAPAILDRRFTSRAWSKESLDQVQRQP